MAMKHVRFISILFCFGSAIVLWAVPQQKPKTLPNDSQTIRVNVEMVSLPVVVTNQDGRRITNLKQEDFEVYEDGVKQDIAGFGSTDEPLEIVLMLDTSGSTQSKLGKIQNAAIDFVYELHPDDEVAILSFANDTTMQSDFSANRERNEYGIKKTRTGDWTVLYEAVWLALEDVLKPIKERKALVLFTDGMDTRSSKASEKETVELAKETRATIYSVYFNTEYDCPKTTTIGGIPTQTPPIFNPLPPIIGGGGGGGGGGCSPPDPAEVKHGRDYLTKLTDYSGGLVFDGMMDLTSAFANVAKELASQYSIGYYSNSSKNDGKFRKVEVRVTKPGMIARTKKGYYAPKDATNEKDKKDKKEKKDKKK
jgi:VWFA-related protein